MGNERIAEVNEIIVQSKAGLRPGSSTAKELQEGLPTILAKCTEESGEFLRALIWQEADQINIECSQLVYHILAFRVFQDRGDIREIVLGLDDRASESRSIPDTLEVAIDTCYRNLAKTYRVFLSPESTNEDVNSTIVTTFWSFQDAMAAAGKGSWNSMLEKI